MFNAPTVPAALSVSGFASFSLRSLSEVVVPPGQVPSDVVLAASLNVRTIVSLTSNWPAVPPVWLLSATAVARK